MHSGRPCSRDRPSDPGSLVSKLPLERSKDVASSAAADASQTSAPDAGEMIAVRVSEDGSMAVVGAPSYFAKHRKPKHPRDLALHDCINHRLSREQPVYRWEFTDAGRDDELSVRGRLLVNDREAMALAALDGVGLACLAEGRVREHLIGKRLVRVLEPFCPPFPGLFLDYPTRANSAPKLQALVEWLRWPARRVGAGRG